MFTITKNRHATRTGDELAKLQVTSRRLFRISMILLVMSILIWTWTKLQDPKTFPISNVNVEGNYPHIAKKNLEKLIMPYVNTGFFAVDITGLRNRILGIPWVANIQVERIWPDTLVIHIEEQQPLAVWNSEHLLNAEGEVFTPDKTSVPAGLPVFNAPQGSQTEVINNYEQMNQQLLNLGLKIQELDLTPRLSWFLYLNNGIGVFLGRDNVFMRLQRFVVVYPKILEPRIADVNYVDMRYTNGMAIAWKSQNNHLKNVTE